MWCGDPDCELCWKCSNDDTNPHCDQCKGAGFVHPLKSIIDTPEGPLGKPDYSRIVPCDRPGCLVENSRNRATNSKVYEIKRYSPKLQTFDEFELVEGARKAFEAAKQFSEGKGEFCSLLIIGGFGSGKTHLCQATALKMAQDGQVVKLRRISELLGELREAMNDSTIESTVREYQQVPVLILDDYNIEQTTTWGDQELERIIDFRYQALLPTMLTTNANLKELDEKVARIQSRFADRKCSLTVVNRAKDYRKGADENTR